jgi:uncharacterized protein YggE
MSAPAELAALDISEARAPDIQPRIAVLPSAIAAEVRPPPLNGRQLRTIEVVGRYQWRETPDRAVFNLTIETHALTANQSVTQNGELALRIAQVLMEHLRGNGVFRVGNCSLCPEYEHPRGREKPVVTGYFAENSITVETGALASVGQLVDTALAVGASRISYFEFGLSDESSARGEALARAALDAQSQAGSLARSLGVRLARVLRANSEAQMCRQAAQEVTAALRRPAEVGIDATVSITYQIE